MGYAGAPDPGICLLTVGSKRGRQPASRLQGQLTPGSMACPPSPKRRSVPHHRCPDPAPAASASQGTKGGQQAEAAALPFNSVPISFPLWSSVGREEVTCPLKGRKDSACLSLPSSPP